MEQNNNENELDNNKEVMKSEDNTIDEAVNNGNITEDTQENKDCQNIEAVASPEVAQNKKKLSKLKNLIFIKRKLSLKSKRLKKNFKKNSKKT